MKYIYILWMSPDIDKSTRYRKNIQYQCKFSPSLDMLSFIYEKILCQILKSVTHTLRDILGKFANGICFVKSRQTTMDITRCHH